MGANLQDLLHIEGNIKDTCDRKVLKTISEEFQINILKNPSIHIHHVLFNGEIQRLYLLSLKFTDADVGNVVVEV